MCPAHVNSHEANYINKFTEFKINLTTNFFFYILQCKKYIHLYTHINIDMFFKKLLLVLFSNNYDFY